MNIFEKIVNHKINHMTKKELLQYAKQFNVNVSHNEAERIAAILNGSGINLFNQQDAAKILRDIERIAGAATAKEVELLFKKFTK